MYATSILQIQWERFGCETELQTLISSTLTAKWSFLSTAQSLSSHSDWDDHSPSISEVFSPTNHLHFQKYILVTSLAWRRREAEVHLLSRNVIFMDPSGREQEIMMQYFLIIASIVWESVKEFNPKRKWTCVISKKSGNTNVFFLQYSTMTWQVDTNKIKISSNCWQLIYFWFMPVSRYSAWGTSVSKILKIKNCYSYLEIQLAI